MLLYSVSTGREIKQIYINILFSRNHVKLHPALPLFAVPTFTKMSWQTVILQCTVGFYVIQSLCPTNTEQNCGHTQSRKHYEASMKIVHVRHENCGYL